MTNEEQNYALEYSRNAHWGQKRKYLGIPYHYHSWEVAEICLTVAHEFKVYSEYEIFSAACLHDVLEDTKITKEQLTEHFGPKIADLVDQVTDVSEPHMGNREQRKHLDRLHLLDACPDAQTIKLADLISNTQSIITFDKDFAVVYMKEKEKTLPFLTKGSSTLFQLAIKVLETSLNYLKKV